MTDQEVHTDATIVGADTAGQIIGAGEALQQINTGYINQIRISPRRDLSAIVKACKAEAALAGDMFFYRWTQKGKDNKKALVQGVSVHGAYCMYREMGNLALMQKPMVETRSTYIFTPILIDLERGLSMERVYRMPKDWTVYGRYDKAQKEIMVFQIGQSKALRDLINSFVSRVLYKETLESAQNSARVAIENMIKTNSRGRDGVIDKFLKRFEVHGVTLEMIEAKIEKECAIWQVDDLLLMGADLTALDEHMETVAMLFPAVDDEPTTEETENRAEGDASPSLSDLAPADAKTTTTNAKKKK